MDRKSSSLSFTSMIFRTIPSCWRTLHSDNDTEDDSDTNDDKDDNKMTTKLNGAARSCLKPKKELRPSIDLIKKILSNWKQLRNLKLSCALTKEVELTSYATIRKDILTKDKNPNMMQYNYMWLKKAKQIKNQKNVKLFSLKFISLPFLAFLGFSENIFNKS